MILPSRSATIVLRRLLTAWFLLAGCALSAGAVTLEQIPSPRPAGWAVDLTGTLPAETLAELNRLGEEVKAQTGAEIAVVVIGTTEGVDPRQFAVQLLNTWGIGERDRNNGLLVFAALDDRAAEIVLGDGLSEDAGARASEEVMQGVMVPRFREGDPAGAVLQGAVACAQRILGAVPTVGAEAAGGAGELSSPKPDSVKNLSAGELSPGKREPQAPPAPEWRPAPRQRDWRFEITLFSLIFLCLATLIGMILLKHWPRRCPHCKADMRLLKEKDDDSHLTEPQKVEEKIGSVDYLVWVCESCGQIRKRAAFSFLTRYAKCPRCQARTLGSTSTVLRHADYDRGGLIRTDYACESCAYTASSSRSTPRLERPVYTDDDDDRWSLRSSDSSRSRSAWSSPSPSASSSGWSSSSSSSSSSDSSSSGSGFGGGRSSGGGASGRW